MSSAIVAAKRASPSITGEIGWSIPAISAVHKRGGHGQIESVSVVVVVEVLVCLSVVSY